MPCMCWYDPPEESKKQIKDLCKQLIDIIKDLSKNGDPLGCDLYSVQKLLDHMYYDNCDEKIE